MLTVLFVDDDASILNGLRRALRGQRAAWDMHFAGSGEDALRLAQTTEFHAVVTDARMPGMDGPSLLERLRADQPGVVRILLSGETGEIPALRASEVAHQFLAKPCEPVDLIAAVERTRAMRQTLSDPALRSLVGGISVLPASPSAVSNLGTVADAERLGPTELTSAVSSHLGLAAKSLAVVNSAFFGLARRVSDLAEVTMSLTPDVLVALARATQQFGDLGGTALADVGALERRAERVAEVARSIAPPSDAASAFTAGLLAGVGHLVLAHPQAASLRGSDHAAVGGALLALWSLPLPIVDAVTNHRTPARAGTEFGLCGAVHVADALVPAVDGLQRATLDLDFLDATGVGHQLETWSEFAAVQGAA